MCGIIAYIGKKNSLPILIDGLKALEYRGYDSAGIAISTGENFLIEKCAGRVSNLEKRLSNSYFPFSNFYSGIAHTRWATHGAPNDVNAHPHIDCNKEFFVAHNGIIENYQELRAKLEAEGHKFLSQTDTEVIAHMLEGGKKMKLEQALLKILPMLRGTYALSVVSKKEPQKIVVARHFSPLILGIARHGIFAASDASAILPYTKNVVYLKDGELATLTGKNFRVQTISSRKFVSKKPEKLSWDISEAKKGGFPHFMLKEINQDAEAMRNAMRGRIKRDFIKLGGLDSVKDKLKKIKKLYIIGCGSTYYAARFAEYLLEDLAGIEVETDIGSEFRYRKSKLDPVKDVVLAISQSGETADTIASLERAKKEKVLTLGIVNVVGSTIARMTDAGVYQYAGPEIGVATTKALVSQLTVIILFALWLADLKKSLTRTEIKTFLKELDKIPGKIEQILKKANDVKRITKIFSKYKNFLFIGRKYNLPAAFEGSLKLKEIAYIHAEGYGSGEMKHGPMAMIDENFATVAIAPQDSVYEKTLSNIQEIKARKGPVLAIATEGDKKIAKVADEVFYIPKTLEPLSSILSVVPLQLLAYYVGVLKGLDVDKPRNLAKSVTVE